MDTTIESVPKSPIIVPLENDVGPRLLSLNNHLLIIAGAVAGFFSAYSSIWFFVYPLVTYIGILVLFNHFLVARGYGPRIMTYLIIALSLPIANVVGDISFGLSFDTIMRGYVMKDVLVRDFPQIYWQFQEAFRFLGSSLLGGTMVWVAIKRWSKLSPPSQKQTWSWLIFLILVPFICMPLYVPSGGHTAESIKLIMGFWQAGTLYIIGRYFATAKVRTTETKPA